MKPDNIAKSLWHLDYPISSSKEDLYNFQPTVVELAEELLKLSTHRTITFSVNAPWGVGKSSLLNLLFDELQAKGQDQNLRVFRFDLWLLGSVDTLLVQNLKTLLRIVAGEDFDVVSKFERLISNYGEKAGGFLKSGSAFLYPPKIPNPLTAIGETISQVSSVTKEKIKKCEEPEELREHLTTLLNSHQGRFFFFIDEIDRLGGDEILSLFRLVKLLSAFPKVNIVAAFDPSIVDAALKNFGGLAFAEKIFSWSYNLPPLDPLNNCLHFLTQLGVLSKGTEFKLEPRQLELLSILSPVFVNGRKSKRLCSSVLFAHRRTNGILDLFDLIAVEAIRLVSPAALEAVLAELTQFHRKAVDSKNDAIVRWTPLSRQKNSFH